jgi:hypothetical protein
MMYHELLVLDNEKWADLQFNFYSSLVQAKSEKMQCRNKEILISFEAAKVRHRRPRRQCNMRLEVATHLENKLTSLPGHILLVSNEKKTYADAVQPSSSQSLQHSGG